MNLLKLYEEILKTAKLSVTKDGYVDSEVFGSKKPFTISGKRLVLPTNEQLRNPDKEARIIFHPLRENPMHYGESEVLASFRSALNMRLNASLALLVASLTRLASSVAEHKKLNPDQSEYLSVVKSADTKTFDALAKIISAMPLGQTTKAFVSIYLKKGGQIEGEKFKKAAIVSFPFYEELLEIKDNVYGVKLRQKDRQVFLNLLKYLFPKIENKNAYSAGSNSNVAPSLECIMGALKNIGIEINTQAENFKNVIDDSDEIAIASDWVDAFSHIESFVPEINRILPQFGNEPKEIESIEGPEKKADGPIPVKEKMEFAGLGMNQSFNSFQAPKNESTQKHLSLEDAFRGGNIQGRASFSQPYFNQNPNVSGGNFTNPGFGFNSPFGFKPSGI